MSVPDPVHLSEAEPHLLVRARIAAGEHDTFAVSIFAPAVAFPQEESFRFALHYYATALYELAGTNHDLPRWIDRIAQAQLDLHSNLFAIAGVNGSLADAVPHPLALAHVSLRQKGLRDRQLTGDFGGLAGGTLARSVVAVCQAVLPHLSHVVREVFPAALANMNASYEMTHRHADPESQHEVPAVAYRAASFI